VCPVYREIGGHAYGCTPYNGPIGAVLTPLLADDVASARDLPFASSLCGACRDVCPVKIDLPRLLLDLRHDLTERGASPKLERMALRAYSSSMKRPARYRLLQRLARMLNRLPVLPPPASAWARTRVFPRVASRSFRELWADEQNAGQSNGSDV
jgi:L-lactate dehydrogenase complex protein LldF